MDGTVRALFLALAALALAIARAHMSPASHDNILRIQLWDAEGLSRESISTAPTSTVHNKHRKVKVNLDALYEAMMADEYHGGAERFARHKVRHKRRRPRQSGTDLPWRFHSGSGLLNVAVYDDDVPWDVIEGRNSGSVNASAVSDSSAPVNVEREVSPPMTLRQDDEMSKQKEFKFHVIKLLEHPYIDPEKYVCVPNSWIRLLEILDGVTLVQFPVEELSEIKKRVEKQEFSENWRVFLANINYSTNSYKDASNYIKNKISDQGQSSTNIVEDVPSTSKQKVLESQSSSETNKVRTTSTLNSDAEPVSKEIPKQLGLTNAEVRIGQTKSKVGTADSSPKARRHLTRQSLRIPLSDNNIVSLPDQTAKENLPKTSHCVEESDKTNNNQENESSAKNPSEIMRKWKILMVLRSVLDDNFKETLEQLHNEFEKNQLLLEKMRLADMNTCKIIKELIKLTDEVNIIMVLRPVLGDNFKETLEQLHNDFEKNLLLLEKMRLAFMENCKIRMTQDGP